jgi:SAM-dependent methyltransferase
MDTETESATELSLFNRSYMLKLRMRPISAAMGPMAERSALCIGTVPAALRARLLALGGDWTFVRTNGPLTYQDGVFDRVLVLDHLEWEEDDYAFIAEVHRVLKTAGILYVDTEHRKRWTFWRPVRRLFGVEDRVAERLRPGYTESSLFDLLKDGFDLQESRTYSRAFTEGAETLLRLAAGAFWGGGRTDGADQEDDDETNDELARHLYRMQSIAYPFFVVASKLDWLLFFTRGYRLRATARRRLWKPRRIPQLRDGRRLVDAALNTKIGTAAPF